MTAHLRLAAVLAGLLLPATLLPGAAFAQAAVIITQSTQAIIQATTAAATDSLQGKEAKATAQAAPAAAVSADKKN